MSSLEILYCTLGMCIVSYLPRVMPPFILSRVSISPFIERWLRYVPTSVFGALVFSEVFLRDGQIDFRLSNVNFLASLVVLAVAVRTKSLGKSIVSGLLVFWLLEKFIG